jgi:putative DNA primase/helicase
MVGCAARSVIREMENDDALTEALRAGIESLAETLLGACNRKLSKKGRELRFGTKGSVSVALQGSKRGSWFDHEEYFGGGPLQLIVHARQCGYDDAEAWARDWINLPVAQRAQPGTSPVTGLLARLRGDAKDKADTRERIDAARRLWAASVPLSGTLGENYLMAHRGIPAPALGWPEAVRFHSASRALIVAATTDDGTVQAVQRVLLTEDGRKIGRDAAQRLYPPTAKVTGGVTEGAAVRLPGQPGGPVLLAEGPETGLSLWAATGIETWIALGSIKRLQPEPGRRIIVGRDDDARYSPAERAVTGAMHDWRKAGCDVVGITPWRVRRYDGSDFNDALRAEGPGAVRDAAMRSLNPRSGASARPRESADAIRWGVAIGACHLFAIATEVPPDQWIEPIAIGCRVDTGIGKSAIARAAAAEALALMRARGDNRTIAVAVPTHKLGDEQAAAFRGLATARRAGLEAAVWRGREADDPAEPGETMCRNLPAVRDAMSAGLEVQSAACRRIDTSMSRHQCPAFDRCGYQRQRRQRADLWLVPHETLFIRKPEAIGDLAALVVDESVWQSGLVGVGDDRLTLTLDELACDAAVPGSALDSERLAFLRNRLRDALCAAPDGPVRREALLAADLTSDAAKEACALEQRRRVDIGMLPGQAAAERARLAASSPNAVISRRMTLWRAVEKLLADDGPAVSGWAKLADAATEYGRVRVVKLKGRKPIGAGWRVPMLLIDATLDARLVRPYWPFYCPAVDLAAVTPWQRVRQAAGRSHSKTSLLPGGDGTKGLAGPGRRNLRRVAAILGREARRHDGKALVVTNKAAEDALPAVWRKPAAVDLAHFNAVAGRDGWRDVAFLATVGSTNPPRAAVEELAEALTGEHVPPLAGWYERHDTSRETADGSYAGAETDRHPHPIAEAIRWQIREGEVIQAIGRARGVNRTEANPVDVLVMGDAVLPVPVEPVDDADLDPSPADLMLAAGGVALESPTHAAVCYPGLWKTESAAKMAFARRTCRGVADGHIPYNEPIIEDVTVCGRSDTTLGRADYQLAGERMHPALAWFDPATVPDPAAWLHERLGGLAWCRVTMPRGADKAA